MSQVYGALKFLRFSDHLEAVRDRRLIAPVHVRIKPINRCNHDCWYCAYRVGNLDLGSDMNEDDSIPEDRMMGIADDLVAMGVKAVTFSGGGEPLLYKPLPRVIARLAAGGVKVASLTNGSNLKGAMADAFAAHGTWVRVSVDAWDDESYQKSRGVKGDAFTRLLDNMQGFAARGSACTLGVSFIVSEGNHQRVYEICRLFKDVGVHHVKVSGAVVANDLAANNRYHRAIMETVSEQIARATRDLNDQAFSVVNHYHELEERFEKDYHICPFTQFLTVIGADQSVYSCQDKAYTDAGLLGSFKESTFKEFWFSERTRDAVWGLDPSRSCQHHCVAHAKNQAILDYLAIDPDHGMFV